MNEEDMSLMDLDLSPLLGDGKYAVHCKTLQEARCFVDQIKTQYPQKAKFWAYGETHWDETDGVYYSPYLNDCSPNASLTWCDRYYYKRHGFEILEFSDLLQHQVDINESDHCLEFLIGGAIV